MIKVSVKSVEIHEVGELAQVVEYTRFAGHAASGTGEEYRRLPSRPRPYAEALAQATKLGNKHDVKVIDYIAMNATVQFCSKQNKQVPA